MTAQQYLQKGFNVSMHVEQSIINRAEADVTEAYVTPIVGTIASPAPAQVTDAVLNLAFLLMLQRNVFATRSGAKTKNVNQSQEADTWKVLQDQAHTCAMKIDELRKMDGANKNAEVVDICRLYFKTNFLYS